MILVLLSDFGTIFSTLTGPNGKVRTPEGSSFSDWLEVRVAFVSSQVGTLDPWNTMDVTIKFDLFFKCFCIFNIVYKIENIRGVREKNISHVCIKEVLFHFWVFLGCIYIFYLVV